MTDPSAPFDWTAFAASLAPIPTETDRELVRRKSRGFYWYSPVAKRQPDNAEADIVVTPRNEREVVEVVRRAVAARVPITPRGGGSGVYGQATPLNGGVVLDLTALDSVVSMRDGILRVGTGTKLAAIEARCKPLGWELRMFPSTRRTATIGGFVAGGMGGVGSINFGQLSDPGTLLSARVVTLEAEPRVLMLRGSEANRVHHAYGATGIITELEIAMAPAQTWLDYVVAFRDFPALTRFAHEIAAAEGISKRLVSAVDGEVAAFFGPLEEELDAGDSVGLFLIATQSVAPFEERLAAHGGRICRRLGENEIEASGALPAFEFTWNHATLQALKADQGITYLQTRFPARRHLEVVAAMREQFGAEVPMHLEFIRSGGEVVCIGMPLVRFSTEARLREIIAAFEAMDVVVFDPYTYVLEDGGVTAAGPGQPASRPAAEPGGI